MEEANPSLWDSVRTDVTNDPKLLFEINIPVTVEFPEDFTRPDEFPSTFGDEQSNYCVFKVLHDGEQASIVTSAFSLLRELKRREPLAGKKVVITKKLVDGKQQYVVEDHAHN